MRAAVLRETQTPLVIEDIPTPVPKAGEVLIRVSACGVCHSDLHVAKGELTFPLPCVLGHEISGTVEQVGAGVVGFQPGQPVVASFIMPCGNCASCDRGRDDLCDTFFAMNRGKGTLYDGTTRLRRRDGTDLAMYSMGGLADYAVVPATDVFAAPANLPLNDACILGCAAMTAYGAVRRQAQLQPGQTVAVIGVGGVGSNVVQWARLFQASRIFAVDIRDDKLADAKQLGATDTINASQGNAVEQVQQLTKGQGVDVAIEVLGRPETVQNAFLMTRDGGTTVVVGIGVGKTTAGIEITRLVRRSIRLIGSYGCRVRTDLPAILEHVEKGEFAISRLVTRRYRLEEVNDAYQALNRGEIIGRAIIEM